jgi:hypothetical protein
MCVYAHTILLLKSKIYAAIKKFSDYADFADFFDDLENSLKMAFLSA